MRDLHYFWKPGFIYNATGCAALTVHMEIAHTGNVKRQCDLVARYLNCPVQQHLAISHAITLLLIISVLQQRRGSEWKSSDKVQIESLDQNRFQRLTRFQSNTEKSLFGDIYALFNFRVAFKKSN